MIKFRASKLQLHKVSRNEEQQFLLGNHYQGYVPSDWCEGLYYNGELICLMSFGTPRFTNKYDYELLRLCTKKGYQVYGGASRLLKSFRNSNIGSIISYCNLDKFTGSVYNALGFKKVRTTKGYHYEKDGKVYSRYQFQRKKCIELWPQYKNTSATESQIMKEQGYERVNDSIGQAAYILDSQDCKWYIYEIIINNEFHYIGQHKYKDVINDNYYGSGLLVRRFIKKYPFTKRIIQDNILSQEEADKYEEQLIKACKETYGEFCKHHGKCLNIRNNGQGQFGTTYGTLGKVPCISPDGHKHFLRKEDVPNDWVIGAFNKGSKLTAESKQKNSEAHKKLWEEGHYNRVPWNKGKKIVNLNKQGIIDGGKRRKAKVDAMIPEGWIRLKEAADRLNCSRQTVLNKYESRIIMEGKQKITIVKL